MRRTRNRPAVAQSDDPPVSASRRQLPSPLTATSVTCSSPVVATQARSRPGGFLGLARYEQQSDTPSGRYAPAPLGSTLPSGPTDSRRQGWRHSSIGCTSRTARTSVTRQLRAELETGRRALRRRFPEVPNRRSHSRREARQRRVRRSLAGRADRVTATGCLHDAYSLSASLSCPGVGTQGSA